MEQIFFKYRLFIMKLGLYGAVSFFIFYVYGCQPGKGSNASVKSYIVKVVNNSEVLKKSVEIEINKSTFDSDTPTEGSNEFVVFSDGEEIPSQNEKNKVFFIIDQLRPNEEVFYTIKEGKSQTTFPKRTQAEISVKKGGYFQNRKYIGGDFENISYLRVPDEHTDHSYYIRYEGPGWESDLVGYRFYLDWRNATDVFGKKTNDLVLQEVGLDGFDSYHEMQDWGMDVLKVGNSLGVGSPGVFYNNKAVRIDKTDSVICQIDQNGSLRSAIRTNYYGWQVGSEKYDVESLLSIHGGTRLTKHQLRINKHPDNLCTGIGKDDNAKLFTDQGNNEEWGYLATYGVQSLNNDRLGLAVLFAGKDFKGFTEDEFSHIVKLNTDTGQVAYYFLAVWEGETDGITSEVEFLDYVRETAQCLSSPVTIEVTAN